MCSSWEAKTCNVVSQRSHCKQAKANGNTGRYQPAVKRRICDFNVYQCGGRGSFPTYHNMRGYIHVDVRILVLSTHSVYRSVLSGKMLVCA